MTMYETLLVERPSPHFQLVTLNRPETLNAINTRMGEELLDFFRSFDLYQEPDLRVIVFTGAGERAFCAGGDLKERQGMDETTWKRQHLIFRTGRDTMNRIPIPLIAAVNGAAYGGGLEFALCCDLIVAAEHARFALSEIKLGIMPGNGGTQRLPRRIGPARAKEMILTGQPIEAAKALEWGLVNRVVPQARLLAEAMELAETVAANGPISLRQAKKAIDRGMDVALDSGLALEIECYNALVNTEDRHEGVNAFNEKRTPRFRNR